jgi:iron complex transport system substrate-binding protein
MRASILALAAAWAAVLAASPAPALTLRDMLGREVTLPAPPARIISLVPSVTEIVFSLGAQERLVSARTSATTRRRSGPSPAWAA